MSLMWVHIPDYKVVNEMSPVIINALTYPVSMLPLASTVICLLLPRQELLKRQELL